jgi:hypothetical protein
MNEGSEENECVNKEREGDECVNEKKKCINEK